MVNRKEKKEIERETEWDLIDAVLEFPHPFRIDGELFYIYPLTLGKTLLMQRIVNSVGIRTENMNTDINLELLRVIDSNKGLCCDLMAYMTARNDYYDVFDVEAFLKRKKKFEVLGNEELASFIATVLTYDKTETFIKHLGIDKEQGDMKKVMDVKSKNNKNSFSFGGVSLYGTLIDIAMERYGMAKRQVVWELDYTSLRILLADKMTSVLVTDDERRKINVSSDRRRIDGDDKDTMLRIINSTNWE